MNTEELIAVFHDTVHQVLQGPVVSYAETFKFVAPHVEKQVSRGLDTTFQVVSKDSVSAARELAQKGRTAILNMASPKRPGGGVRNGKVAQEECLFRCSDLFNTIDKGFYPLGYHEGLYTTDATFFKDVNYDNIEPFKADVITVAALNLNPEATDSQDTVEDYEGLTKRKIRFIFQTAVDFQIDNLVLGAWGCGVYKNNPQTIAEWFFEIASEYTGCFEKIVWAVINDHNSVGNNYVVFKMVMEKFFASTSQDNVEALRALIKNKPTQE